MKCTTIATLLFISFGMLFLTNSHAQCIPDPGCADIDNPGEICPEVMPDGYVAVDYQQVVTVSPPATFDLDGITYDIVKIVISGIDNLPPGLTWVCNPSSNVLMVTNPITKYCILVSGQPTTVGTYQVVVRVFPWVDLGFPQPVQSDEVVDDTSIVITIKASAGISKKNEMVAQIDLTPNPFKNKCTITFSTSIPGNVSLEVFDILGNIRYTDKLYAKLDENKFVVEDEKILPGIYFYRLTFSDKSITSGRIVKAN